ncbi:hypothetical protein B5M09_010011 [Aphanomyces astaci]|nr:hypothetical protein B5M09_010011 [Aphanomyces astaci]
MDGAGLFSPSLDNHSFAFDGSSGGGASAAGTGGSTSNTQPPNHPSFFGPPTTQTSVAVLDAFASATTTNTISFDALDAMNDMDLSVGDKYYMVGLSEGGLDDDKAAAASSSSSFPPTTTPARSTSDLKQSVVDTSRPISRKASIAAAAVPPPPLVAPPTNSSPGFATEFATEFAAAFPATSTTTTPPSFATLFDDQQQPTSGAPFDPPPASSSFFAAFGDFVDTTSSSFEAAFDTPTTTIATTPGFGGDSLSGAAAASSGDQPPPRPPSSSPSCSALVGKDTTISSDDTFGQFEASFEAFGINNADATASWNTAVADSDGFSSWFPSDSTTTTSSSSRAPPTDDAFDPSFGHFTTSATSCDDSVADRSKTSNDDPIGGGIGGGGFENDVTGFAANVTEIVAVVQDTNDPQADCSSWTTGTASHTSQPHKDDHISATTRRISDQGSSSQGGEAGDTATAFQSDQGDADFAALDWSFQAAALPSPVPDDGTNHHMSNSPIGQAQGGHFPIDQDTALNGAAVTSFHDEAVKTEPTVSQIASPPPLPSHQDADSVAVDGCGCLFGLPHDDPTDDDKMSHPSASPSNDVSTPSDEMPRPDRADAEDSVAFPADMSTPSSPPATETTPSDLVSETSFNPLLPPQSAAASATTSAIDDIFGDFTFSPAALGDRRVASDPFLTTFASNAAAFPTSYATEPADASSDNMFADFADFQSSVGTSTWDFPATTFPPSTATPPDDFTF